MKRKKKLAVCRGCGWEGLCYIIDRRALCGVCEEEMRTGKHAAKCVCTKCRTKV